MVQFRHRAAPERVHLDHKRQRGATTTAKATITRVRGPPLAKKTSSAPPVKATAKDAVKTSSAPVKTSAPPAKATSAAPSIPPTSRPPVPSVPSSSPPPRTSSQPATSTTRAVSTSTLPDPSATSVNNTSDPGRPGTSPVVIGLVVALICLVLCTLVGFFVRRWFIRRRKMKRNTWGAGIIPSIEEKRRTMYDDDPNARLANVPATSNKPLPPRPLGYGSAPMSPSPFSSYGPYGDNGVPLHSAHPYPPVIAAPPVARNGYVSPPSSVSDHSQHSYGSQVPMTGPYTNSPGGDVVLTAGAPSVMATPASAIPTALTGPRTLATVARTFIPTLPDELSITNGEVITVETSYDDGWALCTNQLGEQGVVPLECLVLHLPNTQSSVVPEHVTSPVTADFTGQEKLLGANHWRLSKRASSLYGASKAGLGSPGTY